MVDDRTEDVVRKNDRRVDVPSYDSRGSTVYFTHETNLVTFFFIIGLVDTKSIDPKRYSSEFADDLNKHLL